MTGSLAYRLAGVAPKSSGKEPVSLLGLAALLSLQQHPAATVSELLVDLGLPSVGTLSPHLDRLEERGYITRARHQFDHRKTVCSLTPKGVRLLRSARRPEIACLSSPTDASTATSPTTSSSDRLNPSTSDAPTTDAEDRATRKP
jgi:DNA-binding MarR family transcriptional regulator